MFPACLLALAAAVIAWPDPPPPRPAPTASIAPSPAIEALDHLPRLDAAGPSPRPGGLGYVMPAEYVVDLPARSRAVYLLPPGPKVVREIVVQPDRGTAEAWRQARIRLAWETNDPARASVDLPLGLLFGRLAEGRALGASSVLSDSPDRWSCRWPMPYRGDAVLEIDTSNRLAGRLRVMTTAGLPVDLGRFWAVEATAGRVERPGRGRLVGLLLVGRSTTGSLAAAADAAWQLRRDDHPARPLAAAFGLGLDDAPAGTERGEVAAPGARFGAFCWRIAQPLPYDRAVMIERRPAGDDGAAGSAPAARPAPPDAAFPRAVVFGYDAAPARPGPRP